jgi:hypothetical protein
LEDGKNGKVVDDMLFYFGTKRIRMLPLGANEYWWNWDDVANVLEIPAESLLEELAARVPEDQRAEHVRIGSGLIDVDPSLFVRTGTEFEKELEVLGTTRFMSHVCLKNFLELYKERSVVRDFQKWLDSILGEADRMLGLCTHLYCGMKECMKLATAMKYFVYAFDEKALQGQIARFKAELGVIRGILDFIDCGCAENGN